MSGEDGQDLYVQQLIERLKAGDMSARDELLSQTLGRLTKLARMMLRDYPGVKRWEETDDITQGASVRLYRALGEVTPPTPTDYFRLAAVQVRRELLDLARRYRGPQGLGTNHESHDPGRQCDPVATQADESLNPARLAEWSDFHRAAGALPDHLRSVFDLIFYEGLTHAAAGEVLGVGERTVKRYWREAKISLHAALGDQFPGA
jgi:RNA polymerase sigma factor (sigma-70 family)